MSASLAKTPANGLTGTLPLLNLIEIESHQARLPAVEISVQHDILPLELLDRDAWADVAEVCGEHPSVSRLAELGLRAGCRLRMLQPGSPCLLQIGDCRLCLRSDVAAQVFVRPVAVSA